MLADLLKDETIQLINFEAKPAPEDSGANIELSWQVDHAIQVTVEGPGIGTPGLNRSTFYSGTGKLHIKTSETKASYKLTAAPDPQRTINGNAEIDLDGIAADNRIEVDGVLVDPDAPKVTELSLKGVDSNDGVCYVPYNSKQTLKWAFENAEEASFSVKGDLPGLPEGDVSSSGKASLGPITKGRSIVQLEVSKPSPTSKTLDIRIQRAQISVSNEEVKAGEKATLSWEVDSANSIEIIAFGGTEVAAPANPDMKGSLSFDAESGKTYQFKVEATSFDDKKSHKVMSATVV